MRKLVIGIILLGVLAAIGATATLMSTQETPSTPIKTVSSVATTPEAQVYIDQGKSYLQAHNILAARNQFKLALAVDSNSQEANLLLGIVRIFSVVEDGQSLNTSGLDSVREILELSGAIIQNFNIYDSTMQMGKGPAATTPRTGAILDFLKSKALPEVDAAIANLLKVTDPAILYDISPAAIAQNSGSNISVDYADAMVVKSLLYALKCNLELLMVYGLDISIPSIYDNPDQLMTYKAFFQQDATLLTPKDPARLTSAKTALISFIDTYTNDAAPRLISRAGGGHHLFVIDAPVGNEPVSVTSDDLIDITSKLAEVKAALAGAHLFSFVNDQDRNRTVDLSRFFNANAPINIRTSLTSCATGAVFPDPTFNGLFPLGIDGHQQFVAEEGGDLLGVTCSGRETPAVKIDPEQMYFNDQSGYYYGNNNQFYQPGYSSGPQAVTISSYGTAPLNVSSISLGGANSGDFTLTAGTCSSLAPLLAAGASCSVIVDMKRPVVAMGNQSALLQISSNDLSSPVVSSQIQAYLNPSSGGSISGIVRDAKTGKGIQNTNISIYDGQTNVFIQSTWTNSSGGYAFNSLNAGSYKLLFGSGFPYQAQWYSNKFSQGSADPIVLSTNENKANLNVSLLPPPVSLWGGMWHKTKADGSEVDCLNAGINSDATSLAGMTFRVTGPNNFLYTFTEADLYRDYYGQLEMYKEYSTPLAPGLYTFTLDDGNGHISRRSATHITAAYPLPLVDSATIQHQRNVDGSYHFSWAPVNDTHTYYYRLVIVLDNPAEPALFYSSRVMGTSVDVPAWALVNGTAYKARVEVHNAPSFELVTNRAYSAFVNFTPQVSDYNSNRLNNGYASVYNRFESDGTLSTDIDFVADTLAGVTSASVTGPGGFSYSFDLVKDRDSVWPELYKNITAPMSAGLYTFHVVANGLHHYAYATLSAPVTYPAPDASTYQAEQQGNGNIRFSWADVNYTGALYYRVFVMDPTSGQYVISPRTNRTYVEIPDADLAGLASKQWRVEISDSSSFSTQRNRRIGPAKLLAVQPYDAQKPNLDAGFSHVTNYNNADQTYYWIDARVPSGTISQMRLDGPNGYTRNLLTPDGFADNLESGVPATGIYTFTAVGSTGKSTVRYNYQPVSRAIAPVDYKTVNTNRESNGDITLSWAPVASVIPLWYGVEFYYRADMNGDGQRDQLYLPVGYYFAGSSLVIPASSIPNVPFMFRIFAFDGSNATTYNNYSRSVMVGFEEGDFNYASLKDADNDGYASNVDANDNNSSVYPFSPPAAYPLSLSFSGTGNGSVQGGMSCIKGSNCASANFTSGTNVTLMPLDGIDSVFKGWNGACTNTSGNCIIKMDGAKSVTAVFDIMPVVWISPGTAATNYFGSLASAYNVASGGSSILAKVFTFMGNLTLDRGIGITIKGGYNAGYASNSGNFSTLDGILTIESGSLIVEGLTIQ